MMRQEDKNKEKKRYCRSMNNLIWHITRKSPDSDAVFKRNEKFMN